MVQSARWILASRRRLVFIAVFVLIATLSFNVESISAHSPSASVCNDSTCNIDLGDNFFQPSSITIRPPDPNAGVGVVIVWQNHGSVTHTVTSGRRGSPDGIFDQTLAPGAVYQLEIGQDIYSRLIVKYSNGVIPYYCRPHFGMDATLVVSTPQQPALSAATTSNPSTVQSGQTSTITVQVSSGGTAVPDATVTLTADREIILADSGGTTDADGYFTTTLTASFVSVQTTVTVTANTSKTGYVSAQSQVSVTLNPAPANLDQTDGNQANSNMWIYLGAIVIVALASAGLIGFARIRRNRQVKKGLN